MEIIDNVKGEEKKMEDMWLMRCFSAFVDQFTISGFIDL